MKNRGLFFFFFISLIVLKLKGQPSIHLPKYQVEIYKGLTLFGTECIIYNHEGILLRKDSVLFGGRSFIFLGLHQLHMEKLIDLNTLLNESNGLFQIPDTIKDVNGNFPFNYPIRIIVRQLDGEYFKKILDYNFTDLNRPDEEIIISELIKKINDLIPNVFSYYRL
ncbi:MAG: hypothetical protein LAT76_01105 [Schleiferiaceae bacterium]|nr:hypothetical protein [Schleiferiaceae bacterium]